MKILLLGKNGQVGWQLQRSLASLGDVVSTDRNEANLENQDSLRQCIRKNHPDIIVNAAAYTAVDKAEAEADSAYQINAEAVDILAKEAKKINSWLIHYSTDYVYDGKKSTPYMEEDITSPLSVYGASKLAGEELIKQSHAKHLIFRTSWVYGSHGNNFPKTILRLAKEKSELSIVSDQYGAPTNASLIADITALSLYKIIQSNTVESFQGTYNLTASGSTSWHGFAQALIKYAQSIGVNFKSTTESIKPISTEAWPMTSCPIFFG